jgi:hypothetical protein
MIAQLFSAIYSRWSLSAPLYLVEAPQGQGYPYAVMSLISIDPARDFGGVTDEATVQVSLFSGDSSAAEVAGLAESAAARYDGAKLEIEGFDCVQCQRGQVRLFRESECWHAVVEFEINYEENNS